MSCREEEGLEHDLKALGRVVASHGPHDTYCREGVRVMVGFVARTTEQRAKREIKCVAISHVDRISTRGILGDQL